MKNIVKLSKFLTVNDLSERLGVSKGSIWKWAQLNQFPKPVKLNLNTTRWVTKEVLEWEENIIKNSRLNKIEDSDIEE